MSNSRHGSPSGPETLVKTTASIDHGSVLLATVKSGTATVAGLKVTDTVFVNPPTTGLPVGLGIAGAFCSAANTLTVLLVNPTAGNISSGVIAYRVTIVRWSN